jgi:abequosyltransferase
MPQKLLTIIVPTYNRADRLAMLLLRLQQELDALGDRVDVIVGDNASTDHTPAVTAAFLARCRTAQVLRHPRNVGAEENFCLCLDRVTSRFFWIIGDDDLPRGGLVARLLDLLGGHDPDLLHLGSEWLPRLTGAEPPVRMGALKAYRLSREHFASHVNVWVTFISGMVVNRESLLALRPPQDPRRFSGTSLVQLGWVLPLMRAGSRLYVVRARCVLATSGNTGGYKLVSVFATNLPAILDAVCGPASPQRRSVVRILAWNYVPALLWMTRFGDAGRFAGEEARQALGPLRDTAAYRLMLLPILCLPRWAAFPFFTLSRIWGKASRLSSALTLAVRARMASGLGNEAADSR